MFSPDFANAKWVKSSYSQNGMNCVELAHGTTWVKSTYSQNGANCVELASGPSWVAVRDSKDPDSAPLVVDHQVMEQFLAGVRAGEFDR